MFFHLMVSLLVANFTPLVSGRIPNIYKPCLLNLENQFPSDKPQNFARDSYKSLVLEKIINVTELYITVDNHINIVKLRVLRINKIFWTSFLSSAGVWQL